MTKFIIEYEVEAEDKNDALLQGHALLFAAGLDSFSINVRPVPEPLPRVTKSGHMTSNFLADRNNQW